MPWESVTSTAVVCIFALVVPIVIAAEGRQKEKIENLEQLAQHHAQERDYTLHELHEARRGIEWLAPPSDPVIYKSGTPISEPVEVNMAQWLASLATEPVEQDPNQDLYDRIEQAVQDYRKKNAT